MSSGEDCSLPSKGFSESIAFFLISLKSPAGLGASGAFGVGNGLAAAAATFCIGSTTGGVGAGDSIS